MNRVVDLHIHSHYSRATSPTMDIQSLYRFAKIKGIDCLGTGDFTHPAYFGEIREKLEPAEDGLFKLKKKYSKVEDEKLSKILAQREVRFMLSVEISNIYSKNGKVRRLHNVIISPSFESVSTINSRLNEIGNLKADGRPILGLDSKELLKISLESDPRNLFIPAHIWTPWFSMFGSKSGFDTIEEAFEELSDKIVAVESGLSSDPFMNWRLSQLDGITIVSNSDAHSPQKLGREANVINSELTYDSILGAVRTNDDRFVGTIEFFPEEGKYHWDGHRTCNVSLSANDSKKINNICPKCGKEFILGVEHRVSQLADRSEKFKSNNKKTVDYIVPLYEIISEVEKSGVSSKKVKDYYDKLIFNLGDEFSLLRSTSIEMISKYSNERIGTAVDKMRKKDIYIKPGYDGVYGVIKIFEPGQEGGEKQLSLI